MKYKGNRLKVYMGRLRYHMTGFSPIWICLFLLSIAAGFAFGGVWHTAKVLGGLSLLSIVFLLVFKPMNAVYGLMGTTGNVGLFFGNFLFISAIFAGIYYLGFFHNAGVSYDINQPHIEFSVFKDVQGDTISFVRNDKIPIFESDCLTPSSYIVESEEIHYQRIDIVSVVSNTVMTSLMQEPTELFSAASTYNRHQDTVNRSEKTVVPTAVSLSDSNAWKAKAFHVLLIFQIIISWIFFGVFISLLYSKFRNES